MVAGDRRLARPPAVKRAGSPSTQSQTWVSRRIRTLSLEGSENLLGEWRIEVLGDPQAALVDAEELIHALGLLDGDQPRDGLAPPGDDHLVTPGDLGEEPRKMRLGLVAVYRRHPLT